MTFVVPALAERLLVLVIAFSSLFRYACVAKKKTKQTIQDTRDSIQEANQQLDDVLEQLQEMNAPLEKAMKAVRSFNDKVLSKK